MIRKIVGILSLAFSVALLSSVVGLTAPTPASASGFSSPSYYGEFRYVTPNGVWRWWASYARSSTAYTINNYYGTPGYSRLAPFQITITLQNGKALYGLPIGVIYYDAFSDVRTSSGAYRISGYKPYGYACWSSYVNVNDMYAAACSTTGTGPVYYGDRVWTRFLFTGSNATGQIGGYYNNPYGF